MARIMGLGHVGIFVRDLERMAAFYRDVMGMTLTKQNWRSGIVFFSADPDAVDHEIALVRGRPENDNPKLIHQISLRVDSLDGLREFHRPTVLGAEIGAGRPRAARRSADGSRGPHHRARGTRTDGRFEARNGASARLS